MQYHHAMPHISVESPVTHNSWEDKKYTTYDIVINCEDDACPLFALPRSSFSRRFKEFRWLRRRLCAACPYVRNVPQLPTLGCPILDDRFSPTFIEKRRKGLEQFLQGVCSIPTLLSEAVVHLFIQTDLSTTDIDGYVDRKWRKGEEVYDIIVSLHQKKQTEERDEIASMASMGRWSEASPLDEIDEEETEDSASSVAITHTTVSSKKRSRPRAVVSKQQIVVEDEHVISPVLGLYIPPDEEDEHHPDETHAPQPRLNRNLLMPVTADRFRNSGRSSHATSLPVAMNAGNYRRSRSVQQNGRIPLELPSSSSSTEGSIQDREIFQRRRTISPGPPYAGTSPKVSPYYCSNAVWLSAASSMSNHNLTVGTSSLSSSLSHGVSNGRGPQRAFSSSTSSLSSPSTSS